MKVYIRTDESNRVVDINSGAFLTDLTGWVEVDEGTGDRYNHAQGNYLPLSLVTEGGAYRYAYTENGVVERSADDIAAEETAAAESQQPTTEERVAQLEQALELLLSGVTE